MSPRKSVPATQNAVAGITSEPVATALEPTRGVRTFEAIVAQIRAAISEQRLRPGDRLPPALELAREFGVSRNGVLEALRVLERAGLVSLRRGSRGGAFVRALAGDELTEPLHLMMEIDVPVADMVEMRRLVEGRTAAWAAERASVTELKGIERVVRCWEELAEGSTDDDWLRALAEDVRFHKTIADASHNAAAAAFVRGMLGSLNRMLKVFPKDVVMSASKPLGWVFEPIAARDPTVARERMQQHIGDFSGLGLVLQARTTPKRRPAR
jgi:GntR family transcriptional regulator, transcriptional repressor for pyruvate dehydrogenase complex